MLGRIKALVLLIIVILIGIYIFKPLYTVDETEQAVVLEWGVNPVKVAKDAGLHFKWPWPYQSIIKFEKRLLQYDAQPREIITKDKKTLILDNYARWRIEDPIKFLQTVKNEPGAQSRIDDIVYSELRVETASHDQIEVIAQQRETIMKEVTKRCNEKAKEYGIEIVDVRIKRADLPQENEQSVFQRMVAERERQAKKYRSEGQSEATRIRAEADRESRIIISEAYKQAQITKGEGDAQAIKIYGRAYDQDPDFYSFVRTLETYDKSLNQKTTGVFSTDSEIFKLFQRKELSE
ncbi:MAG TPA: protease modulator HflC [Thermodesulfobacteriota bacterium]|nr:protease modulator HflC [Thermodesulfobacteriota bacterium]